jgi:2-oxoglutarate dehydrogenase E2 component (dihydrolipoamide succinyltransferase)
MAIDIKAPSPGESIAEVQIATWLKAHGDAVTKGEPICEIETDKATLEVAAEASGTLAITVAAEAIVPVGTVIATIDPSGASASAATAKPTPSVKAVPAPATNGGYATGQPSPAAGKILAQRGVDSSAVVGSGRGGRVTKADALAAPAPDRPRILVDPNRPHTRSSMSMLRRSLARRMVTVKNETAMLTTFNEIDMQPVMALRKAKQQAFQEKFGTKLGFMSFFTRAVVTALQAVPEVNAMIDGDEIIRFEYCDVGIAVSAPKGLMVPVIRNAQTLSSGDIEVEIKALAEKARDAKLSIDEMTGGTFTITNGGVFGSMLSTPILNPPQSAILGMHNIVDRPVAIEGKVEIRPIMYVALSYDHRIVDGRESVTFLKTVKEAIESPEALLTGL